MPGLLAQVARLERAVMVNGADESGAVAFLAAHLGIEISTVLAQPALLRQACLNGRVAHVAY